MDNTVVKCKTHTHTHTHTHTRTQREREREREYNAVVEVADLTPGVVVG